jgi:hypothetical protein
VYPPWAGFVQLYSGWLLCVWVPKGFFCTLFSIWPFIPASSERGLSYVLSVLLDLYFNSFDFLLSMRCSQQHPIVVVLVRNGSLEIWGLDWIGYDGGFGLDWTIRNCEPLSVFVFLGFSSWSRWLWVGGDAAGSKILRYRRFFLSLFFFLFHIASFSQFRFCSLFN